MQKIVQPPATLRFFPASKPSRIDFCKAYGLRNEYLQDMINGGRSEHKGWQRLDNVRWLQHVETGELIVVVGKPKLFIDTVAKQRSDMPFDLRCSTADAFEHAGKHARAYAREPCELGSIPRRVEPDKLLSLLFDDSLRGMRCAALCTLLRCLAHTHDRMLSPHCAFVWQAVAVDLSLATESRGRGR